MFVRARETWHKNGGLAWLLILKQHDIKKQKDRVEKSSSWSLFTSAKGVGSEMQTHATHNQLHVSGGTKRKVGVLRSRRQHLLSRAFGWLQTSPKLACPFLSVLDPIWRVHPAAPKSDNPTLASGVCAWLLGERQQSTCWNDSCLSRGQGRSANRLLRL